MPDHEDRAKGIDALVELIESLTPFLDCSGQVFCHMPHTDEAKRGILALRHRQVRALLFYRFRQKYTDYPGRERVHEAIEYVEGKLLATRQGPVVTKNCPVLRCFIRAIEEEDGGSGSANEILKMLRRVNSHHRLLKGAEKLPPNPTAMGKWLAKNQLMLQANGVEIERPPRGSKKRLWDWRKIIRDDDTSDTSPREASPDPSLLIPVPGNENRPNDTLSNEELNQMLKEAQS